VNFERIVLTTFPGYFYSQIKCLRSIQQYAAGFPIDIIIDDFDIQHWPTYVEDCQQYIRFNFPDTDITFHKFSDFPGMDRVRTGGWFRQQLVKLYLDQFVSGNSWLLVDADVEFVEPVRVELVSAVLRDPPTPVDLGNRLYVQQMLNCDKPWVIDEQQYWCVSGVPFRLIQRDLLQQLRQHIETANNQNIFDLHLHMFDAGTLVAYDPGGQTAVMSEFQLIEVFRHRYYHTPLPIGDRTVSNYNHSSIKDWNHSKDSITQYAVVINEHWDLLQNFGKHHV